MPYTMNDYPDSLKNLERLERRKAIDIINAMIEDGYDEDEAIPIGTRQAEKWYKDADSDALRKLENKNIQKHEESDSRGSDLINNDVEVYFEDDEWKVKTEGAEQASKTFKYKTEAVEYAEGIAENRGTKTNIHKRGES
ncbi:DUF2188 domain-containing protein [Corticicoccus populi]|uniref:DUF2188 domain-containing protein n=1 Tax=Corticicoccus populi TaxID=1812821 RepID=A0ABW5X2A7_9STAP